MSIEYRVMSSEKKIPLSREDSRRSVQRSWQGCVQGAGDSSQSLQSTSASTEHTPHLCQPTALLSLRISPLKRGVVLFLFILGFTTTVFAQETQSVERPEQLQILESYFRMAVERNPELASLRQEVEARRQKITQERTLPDPEIGAGFYINPKTETDFFGRFSVSAMQMFPWFGTLDTRGQVEESASEVMFYSLNARQLEIFTEIQNLWYEYYQIDHHIHITMEIIQLVRDLESLVGIRYETGRAGQVDLLRIQMEEQRLLTRIEELKDEKNPIREGLNALLNREPDEAIDIADELPERMLTRTKEELFRLAWNHHPDFSRIDAQRDQFKREMDLARLEGRPSFGIGMEYMGKDFGMMSMMDLDHVFIGMATVRIPLYRNKYQAQKREAHLQLQATDHLESDLANRLQSKLERTMKALRDAQRDYSLIIEELLPRSEQAVNILSEEYAGGQVRFDELLQMLRELLMLEMERVNALVGQNKAMAAIEQLMGNELISNE